MERWLWLLIAFGLIGSWRGNRHGSQNASLGLASHKTGEAMTEAWGKLQVDWDDEIVITLPFTDYTVTYYKSANSPGLATFSPSQMMGACL